MRIVLSMLKILLVLILVFVLTMLTQVGGIILLISLLLNRFVARRFNTFWTKTIASVMTFMVLYLVSVFVFVPIIAKPFGRVALLFFEERHVQPTTVLTCLLNRHYVRPELKEITFKVGEGMNKKYPGTTLNYLDANFPFMDEFPLLPHLSHDDGKKLDVSFLYMEAASNERSNEVPSWLGYGVCEEPKTGEEDRPGYCARQGFWQYSFLPKVISQEYKSEFRFDTQRTRSLVNYFISHDRIGKIFIEPHLKTRMKLENKKIRLHGCQAVRHDDHLHVQLK